MSSKIIGVNYPAANFFIPWLILSLVFSKSLASAIHWTISSHQCSILTHKINSYSIYARPIQMHGVGCLSNKPDESQLKWWRREKGDKEIQWHQEEHKRKMRQHWESGGEGLALWEHEGAHTSLLFFGDAGIRELPCPLRDPSALTLQKFTAGSRVFTNAPSKVWHLTMCFQ